MAITTKRVSRVFKHGATEYPDPSPSSKPEQCLALLATGNPTFNNAILDGPTIEGGRQIYQIKIAAGTKG